MRHWDGHTIKDEGRNRDNPNDQESDNLWRIPSVRASSPAKAELNANKTDGIKKESNVVEVLALLLLAYAVGKLLEPGWEIASCKEYYRCAGGGCE